MSKCGCTVKLTMFRGPWPGKTHSGGPQISYCPLHASAPQFLTILEKVMDLLNKKIDYTDQQAIRGLIYETLLALSKSRSKEAL